MKRLSILLMSVLMTVFLAACGDNAEKKIDASVETTTVETPTTEETAKPAEPAPAPAPAEAPAATDTTTAPAQ